MAQAMAAGAGALKILKSICKAAQGIYLKTIICAAVLLSFLNFSIIFIFAGEEN